MDMISRDVCPIIADLFVKIEMYRKDKHGRVHNRIRRLRDVVEESNDDAVIKYN